MLSGRVFAGELPVQGASVRIPVLGMGASTDAGGRYSMIIPSSRVRGQTVAVVARHVRYGSETVNIVLVGGAVEQNFTLRVAERRVEEPVTTTGPQRRAEPASPVGQEPFSVGAAIDVPAALQGRFPGLRVATSPTLSGSSVIHLRGPRSIVGTSAPLVVVNGIPLEGAQFSSAAARYGFGGFDYGTALNDINPGDILAVRVLQGADAVANYGGRGANGVIELSLQNGRGLTGLEITANQRVLFGTPQRLPEFQDRYGQGLGGAFEFFDGAGGGINDAVPESWGPAFEGQPIPQASYDEPRLGDVRHWLARPDNVRDFYGSNRIFVSEAAVAGGGVRHSFRLSARNLSAGDLAPGSALTRRSVTISGSRNLFSTLNADAHIRYITGSTSDIPSSGYSEWNPAAGFLRTGRQVDIPRLRERIVTNDDEQVNWIYAGNRNNPYFASERNDNSADRTHLVAGGGLSYAIGWLTVSARASRDAHDETRRFAVARGWLGGFSTDTGHAAFSAGGYQASTVEASESSAELFATATTSAARPWTLALTLGAGVRDNDASTSTLVYDSAAVGADTAARRRALDPLRWNGAVSTTHLLATGAATWSRGARLSATLRQETVAGLPEESALFPAVGARLDLRQLSTALRNVGRLSVLELRAGWSATGRDLTPWERRSAYVGAQSTDDRILVELPPALADSVPNREKTTGWEAGMDVGLGSRFTLAATVYGERSSDVAVPRATATGVVLANSAELSNRGVQLAVGATPLLRGRLRWDVSATYTRNANEVVSIDGGSDVLPLGPTRWGVNLFALKGEPLGVLTGSSFRRDASGALLLNAGLPQVGPTVLLGDVQPDWFGGFTSTLRYGRYELGALLDGQVGGRVFSATNMWGATSGNLEETEFRPDSGILVAGIDEATGVANTTRVSTERYYRAMRGIAERWVYSASYLKLREMRVGAQFQLPGLAMFRTPTLQAWLVGRNLALWAKAPNIDPESPVSGTAYQGFEFGQLPRARTVGVQVTLVP